MHEVKDYVMVQTINNYEFGLMLIEMEGVYSIRVIVVDHVDCKIRTIGCKNDLGDALSLLYDCIQYGIEIDGLAYTPHSYNYDFWLLSDDDKVNA